MNQTETERKNKGGSALVVVLWILMIISLIVSLFAFEMQLESKIITLQRKRFKADQLALAGVELAKAMLLVKEKEEMRGPIGERIPYEDPFMNYAVNLKDGIPVTYIEKIGDGEIRVHLDFEKGRRNIKTMTPDDWKQLFDQAGIPSDRWDPMLDCLEDWQDEGDLHKLNGAESDDPFYTKRKYECKNAPVDTVDELLLIKNWGDEVLYGTPPDEIEDTDEVITGIAQYLTVWGDGRINPNSSSREVLNSIVPLLSEGKINEILEKRLGRDREAGTADDGITEEGLNELDLDGAVFSIQPEYVSITSVGDVGGLQSTISCIFMLGEEAISPVFWLEGKISE